jgi:CDP-6-deoxy-D-xylo-4-hexulose-3-dehydrase
LQRLDKNNELRKRNLQVFLSGLDRERFYTEFSQEGSSNYAFTVVLRNPDSATMDAIMSALRGEGVEFRRGLSGGGNQLRQPYLRKLLGDIYLDYPVTEHVHFYGMYIGNYPGLREADILWLCELLNSVKAR